MNQQAAAIPLQREKIFFPNLDGLRFFSFLVVFFAHIFSTRSEAVQNEMWYGIFKGRLFNDGDMGVSFFFVLSGFLITYLLIREKELTGTVHIRSFYLRRTLRIWPLYYFCVFFGFLIFPVIKTVSGLTPNENADPWLCSLFLNNFNAVINGPPDSSILSVLWSVAIEEQFYLVWPILFHFTPAKRYHYIFAVIIAVSLLYRFVYRDQQIELLTPSVISDMAIGGLGAYLCISNEKFKFKIENMSGWIHLIPYAIVVVLLVFRHNIFDTAILITFKRVIVAFFFCWIIVEQNFAKYSFFKISNLKTISVLGKYTYGLYCLHTIAVLIVSVGLDKLGLNIYSWQLWLLELPLAMGLSIIFSYFSYHFFERRFLKLKDQFAFIVKG